MHACTQNAHAPSLTPPVPVTRHLLTTAKQTHAEAQTQTQTNRHMQRHWQRCQQDVGVK